MNEKGELLCDGPGVLAPDWLSPLGSSSAREALVSMVGCPPPPSRPDLDPWSSLTTLPYIEHQIQQIQQFLASAQFPPKDVNKDHLLALSTYTLKEISFSHLLNGWLSHRSKRPPKEMVQVGTYLRLLMESLWGLPERFGYEGYGICVLDASGGPLKQSWNQYKKQFKVGRGVNFHSLVSFGMDERSLSHFLSEEERPLIVLQCNRIVGYQLDEISMRRLKGEVSEWEGEVLMVGPSYFKVEQDPIKINNVVLVTLKYDEETSRKMSYLSTRPLLPSPHQDHPIPLDENWTNISTEALNTEEGKLEYIQGIQTLDYSYNLIKAKEFFEASAAKKFPPAYERLSFCYSGKRDFRLKDDKKCLYWMCMAFKNEHWFEQNKDSVDPHINLAIGYFYHFIKKKHKETLKYLKIASNMGNTSATYTIGICYNEAAKPEMDKAVKYFQLAADQGHTCALNNLGVCYKHGEGVARDVGKANHYFQIAADKGNSNAINNLGSSYFSGVGVEKDDEKALTYYRLAVDLGCASALNSLGHCYKYGCGVPLDGKEAMRYYMLAAEMGNSSALNNVGCSYYYGDGVEKDLEESKKYFEQAAEMGNKTAQHFLESSHNQKNCSVS